MMFFLVWSIEHDAWWRPARRGYTRDVLAAGIYSADEAEEIVRDANVVQFHECRIPIECVGLRFEVTDGVLVFDRTS